MLRVVVGAIALAAAGAAVAHAKPDASDKDDPNRVICKRITPTGSRTRYEEVCATAAEWKAAEKTGQDFLKSSQSRSALGSGQVQSGMGGTVQ
jgi:hypothetical protein